MLKTYLPSGHVKALAIPAALLVAVLYAALAWLYQALVDWIPLVYLNFLATVGYGVVGAAAMGAVVRYGRCRNGAVAVALALLVAGSGVAASHYFAYQRTAGELAASVPEADREQALAAFDFSTYMQLRVDAGWSIGRRGSGTSIKGPFVYAVWGVEALVILGIVVGGALRLAKWPYCERCNQWAVGPNPVMVRSDLDQEAVDRLKRAMIVDEILTVQPAAKPGAFTVTFETAACPQCPDSTWLTVSQVVTTVDRKGRATQKKTTLVQSAHLEAREVQRLKALEAQAGKPPT